MLPRVVSLDSDVLIWYLRGDETVRNQLHTLLDEGVVLICSALVVYEVMRGMKPHDLSLTRALLQSLGQAEVSAAVVEEAYALFLKAQKGGRTLPFIDSLIAATAIIEQAPLLTLNTRHYPKQCLLRG